MAVASFELYGTLKDLVQYTTYPYDYKNPVEKEFWINPIKKDLHLALLCHGCFFSFLAS